MATTSKKKTQPRLTKAQKLKKEIARRNRLFKKATAAQKRVLIAQDVIEQIKAKRYVPQSQTWARLLDRDGESIEDSLLTDADDCYDADKALKTQTREAFLAKDIATCECCALGAVMMSCTLFNNHQSLYQFDNDADIFGNIEDAKPFHNGLNKIFSREQLALIELAFEGGLGGFRSTSFLLEKYSEDQKQRAISYRERATEFAEKFYDTDKPLDSAAVEAKTDSLCMIEIMRNIIKNNGTFKP